MNARIQAARAALIATIELYVPLAQKLSQDAHSRLSNAMDELHDAAAEHERLTIRGGGGYPTTPQVPEGFPLLLLEAAAPTAKDGELTGTHEVSGDLYSRAELGQLAEDDDAPAATDKPQLTEDDAKHQEVVQEGENI